MRRAWSVIWAAAIVRGAVGVACAASLPSAGCLFGGEPAEIVAVNADFSLVLADGRTVLLPGVDPVRPDDDPAAVAAREALSRWLVRRTALVRPLSAEPDRWGRTPALVFAPSPVDPNIAVGSISVAEAMLDAGAARARPDARMGQCWPTFRTLEAGARAAGLGLWREARYAIIAAQDLAGLRDGTGRQAIVEGRILRVGEGRARTYLGFADRGRDGFEIVVPASVAAALQVGGGRLSDWRGRDIRVRGVLDDRFGMQIELTSADQIEFTGAN